MPTLTMPARSGEKGLPLGIQTVVALYGDVQLLASNVIRQALSTP